MQKNCVFCILLKTTKKHIKNTILTILVSFPEKTPIKVWLNQFEFQTKKVPVIGNVNNYFVGETSYPKPKVLLFNVMQRLNLSLLHHNNNEVLMQKGIFKNLPESIFDGGNFRPQLIIFRAQTQFISDSKRAKKYEVDFMVKWRITLQAHKSHLFLSKKQKLKQSNQILTKFTGPTKTVCYFCETPITMNLYVP